MRKIDKISESQGILSKLRNTLYLSAVTAHSLFTRLSKMLSVTDNLNEIFQLTAVPQMEVSVHSNLVSILIE